MSVYGMVRELFYRRYVSDAEILHKIGTVGPNEPIVFDRSLSERDVARVHELWQLRAMG